MHDIVEGLAVWRDAGVRFAVATVVRTWRSAPRRPGAAMAVAENGDVIGSVSGGCVEGAVYELAREVIDSGVPVLQTYGVSDGRQPPTPSTADNRSAINTLRATLVTRGGVAREVFQYSWSV